MNNKITKKTYISLFVIVALSFLAVILAMAFSTPLTLAEEENRGVAFDTSGKTINFENHMELDTNTVKSISFEYKFTSEKNKALVFMLGNWDDYYGYFNLDGNGNPTGGGNYQGLTTTLLADGYIKVSLDFAHLNRTNNSNNTNNIPDTTEFLYMRGSGYTTATGYVDNLTYVLYDNPVVIDGAAIKLSEPYAIKFKAFLPPNQYDSTATYGMLIVPSESLTINDITGDYYTRLSTVFGAKLVNVVSSLTPITSTDKHYAEYGEGYIYYGVLNNIKSADINRKFTAIGYKLKGGVYTYYDMREDGRSVSEIAKIAYLEHKTEYSDFGVATLKSILTTAGYGFDEEELLTDILSTTHVTPYVVDNTSQILKTATLPSSRSTTLTFEGAKGERETAQLMLYMNTAFDSPFSVRFSDFTNGNNVISSNCVTSYIQLYQEVKTNWSVTYDQPTRWYGTDYVEDLPLGWYPDALLPYTTAVACNENVMTTSHGNNQGLFFVLEIPENALAGVYTGEITLTIAGEGIITLPVNITVYNFAIPENESKVAISISNQEITYLYGSSYSGMDGMIYSDAFEFLADRGVAGGRTPGSAWSYTQLTNQIKSLKKYALDDRIATYMLPFNYTSATFTVRYKKNYTYTNLEVTNSMLRLEDYDDGGNIVLGLKTIFAEFVKASTNECNLFKKAVIYFPQADEPSKDKDLIQNLLTQDVVNQAITYTLNNSNFTGKSEVRDAVENLGYIVTASPKTELYTGYTDMTVTVVDSNCASCGITVGMSVGVMDGFCPLFTDYYETKYASAIADLLADEDKTMWWYGCVQPVAPYASYILNSPMIRARTNRWQQFGWGVEGELYYMCNRTSLHADGQDTPLTEAQILAGEATFEDAYADGLLIYSVCNTYGMFSDMRKQVQTNFLSSLRLENVAEGNDDYNYLVYAQKLIDGIANSTTKTSYQNRLTNILNTLYSSPIDNTKDYTILKQARANLVQIIIELA